jgi:hypothetical protein
MLLLGIPCLQGSCGEARLDENRQEPFVVLGIYWGAKENAQWLKALECRNKAVGRLAIQRHK